MSSTQIGDEVSLGLTAQCGSAENAGLPHIAGCWTYQYPALQQTSSKRATEFDNPDNNQIAHESKFQKPCCQAALDLSKKDIKKLIINSFKSSFLTEREKKVWIEKG